VSMGDFIKYIADEWHVIWQAPVTFIAAILAVCGLVWAAMEFRYRSVIDSLNERIRLRDDQIAQVREKVGTASPDEIRARIDQLEAQVRGLAPPRLTEDQKQRLSGMLRNHQGKCAIAHDVAAAPMRGLLADLIGSFRDAGWAITTPVVMGPGMHPSHGIGIKVSDANNLTAVQDGVLNAFRAAKIEFDLESGAPFPMRMPGEDKEFMSDVFILVTSKIA
jgi:hypothetical protein